MFPASPLLRVALLLVLVVALFLFPWWVAFIGIMAGIIFIHSYYEALALSIVLDLLFLAGSVPVISIIAAASILAMLIASRGVRADRRIIS